jgi:hypothetical protein
MATHVVKSRCAAPGAICGIRARSRLCKNRRRNLDVFEKRGFAEPLSFGIQRPEIGTGRGQPSSRGEKKRQSKKQREVTRNGGNRVAQDPGTALVGNRMLTIILEPCALKPITDKRLDCVSAIGEASGKTRWSAAELRRQLTGLSQAAVKIKMGFQCRDERIRRLITSRPKRRHHPASAATRRSDENTRAMYIESLIVSDAAGSCTKEFITPDRVGPLDPQPLGRNSHQIEAISELVPLRVRKGCASSREFVA